MKEHNNKSDIWTINLFRHEIERGDTVFIWLTKYKGKETRGIYAMAKITGLPDENPDRRAKKFDWQHQYWTSKEARKRVEGKDSLELEYTRTIIKKPILKDELEAAGLENLLILKMPRATIYKVTEECETIRKMFGIR